MRVRMTAALVAGGLLLSSCSPEKPPPAAPTMAPPSSAAPAPALRIGAAPLWTLESASHHPKPATSAPLDRVRSVQLVGDALLATGYVPGQKGRDRLAVHDAATGKLRWSVTAGDRVPGGGGIEFRGLSPRVVGDPAGDWSVVVTSERKLRGDDVEDGLLGLSGRDGRPLWRIPVQRESRCTCPWTRLNVMLAGPAAESTVLVEIESLHVDKGTTATRTIAFDPATGRQRWVAKGASPRAIAGDLALVDRPELPAKESFLAPATAAALDLRTGRPKWELPGRIVFAGDDTAVVRRDGSTVFADLATGRELGTAPGSLFGCRRTDALFACQAPTEIGGDEARAVTRAGDTVTAAVIAGSGACRPLLVRGADALCTGVTAGLPGALKAVDDRHAVTFTEKDGLEQGTYGIYAVVS